MKYTFASAFRPVMNLALLFCLALSLVLCAPHMAQAKDDEAGMNKDGTTSKETTVKNDAMTGANELRFKLPNGLDVYLVRDTRFPLVCTRLYVRTGSANEKPEDFGISHVLEHMVFKGTESRPKGQIARDVESRGGSLNAYTSFDKTCYLTDMPASQWKTGLDVVRDMAFHPALEADELEREKPVIISELEGDEDNPVSRLVQESLKAAFAGTPYGHPVIGYRETVNAVTPDSLRAYIRTWYQPQNMLLVMAGDIDLAQVRAHVEKEFAAYENRDDLTAIAPIDPASIRATEELGGSVKKVEVLPGKWNKVYLSLAFPVPELTNLGALNLDVLSYLLAGDGATPFEKKYRHELKLVDQISVGNMGLERLGLFTVTAVLDADKTERFFTEIVKDLKNLDMKAFTAEDLERAKFVYEDSFDRNAETLNGLTTWRALMALEFGGPRGEANMREYLRNIDFASVERARAEYLVPERLTVRALVPEGAQVGDLAAILEKEWPAGPDAGAESASVPDDGREQMTLENGVTLVLIPDTNVPYVSVHMAAAGGNALLDTKTQGLSTLAAGALSDGAGELDREAFEKALASRAMSISASSARQTFSLNGKAPARFGKELLDLLTTVYLSPRFEEAEIEREKKDMQSARKIRDDESLGALTSRLWPALFGDHPYGYDSLGTEKTVAGFTKKDVEAFWARQKNQPWVVVFAGTYDREAAIAFAKSLPKAADRAVSVKEPSWSREKELKVDVPDRNKAHLIELWPTVPQGHKDAPALKLLKAILAGQSGLLFASMRDEQSLGYTVTAQNFFAEKAGFTTFYAGTEPDRVEEARAGFAKIVAELKEKDLPKELLEAGCNTLEGAYVRARQSLSSRAAEAAGEILLDLPRDFAWLEIEKARTLAPKDLREVVVRYFEKPYVAVAIPGKSE